MIRNIMQRGSDNKEWVENCFFLGGDEFFLFFPDSCSLIFAAFRSYNLGFHMVFARFCSSYACWVGGGRG